MSAIGSSLDVNGIVSQLVAAERAPTDARNDRTGRQLQAQISALGSLRSAFPRFARPPKRCPRTAHATRAT